MGSCLRIPVGFFTLMCVFFFSFCFFRATPTTYGGSQARGPIGAVAADIHHSSRQCWILNPLSETRNRIWFSWILVRLISTMQDALYFAKGTLYWSLLIHVFFFFFFLHFFRAVPAAYGRSQASGQIRVAAAGLWHSHNSDRSQLYLPPTA